jgi:hypothetical protein
MTMNWLQGDRRRVFSFWRLTGIRWGLDSSLMKHCLLRFPSCPCIKENDGHVAVSLHTMWLFCQSWTSEM